MPIKNSLDFISQKLHKFELYPYLAQTYDKILEDFCLDLSDSRDKYRDTLIANEDRIREMIAELGFDYINDILSSTSNDNDNFLLSLSATLSLFKGHRDGLILVMKLLGFDVEVVEWWQKTPKGEPHTFDMEISLNSENVDNVLVTVENIREFVKKYVYPKFNIATLVFVYDFVDVAASHSGFIDLEQDVCIEGIL